MVSAADAERFSLMWTLRADSVWTERDGSTTRLVLRGPDRDVLWFADRPVRKSGRITMARFVAAFDDPQFRKDPPNAAVTVAHDPGGAAPAPGADAARRRTDAVVELSAPRFDEASGTLSFACRCQIGDVDNSWLLATTGERPATGDVAVLVDPYETPPDVAFGGFVDDIAPGPYCDLTWAPHTAQVSRPGYPGKPWRHEDPGPNSKLLASGKWDTDTWARTAGYATATPGPFTGTFGVAASRGAAFRGCEVWVRIALDYGGQLEIVMTSGAWKPFGDPDFGARCTVTTPSGRVYDAIALGICRETNRKMSEYGYGPRLTVEFDADGWPA